MPGQTSINGQQRRFNVHLSGCGGTNDGIIGAAAEDLTASGWSGRFIKFDRLREFPDPVAVSELEQRLIRDMSLEEDANRPSPEIGWCPICSECDNDLN